MGDLQRFLTAQDGQRGDNTLYELALKEIQEGNLGFECCRDVGNVTLPVSFWDFIVDHSEPSPIFLLVDSSKHDMIDACCTL